MIRISKLKGFENVKDMYLLDENGDIYSEWRGLKKRKATLDKDGYLRLELRTVCEKKKINVGVHRLIATAYHENPDNKSDVDHINEIKTDNRACNLRWSTHKANVCHSFAKPVYQYNLDGSLEKVWDSMNEVGLHFNERNVRTVCGNERRTAYGYRWSYDRAE